MAKVGRDNPQGINDGLCNYDEIITGTLSQCYLLNIGLTLVI